MFEEMKDVTSFVNELVKNKPSTEVFKIQSLDGKKIMTSSLDEKEHSCESRYKKEGFLVLFTNY